MAFFGWLGPVGTYGSVEGGVVAGAGGVAGVVLTLLVLGVEEENLEEILDSHEFRRELLGEGDPDFDMLPFPVPDLSVDPLLANPGLLFGIVFGADGCSAGCPFPLCATFTSFSDALLPRTGWGRILSASGIPC